MRTPLLKSGNFWDFFLNILCVCFILYVYVAHSKQHSIRTNLDTF